VTGITRTSLTPYAKSMQDADPRKAFELGQEAYRRDGIVCIPLAALEARCGWSAARQLRNLGDQYFGKRKF